MFQVMQKTHYYLVDTSVVTPGAAVSELQFHIIQEEPFTVHNLKVSFNFFVILLLHHLRMESRCFPRNYLLTYCMKIFGGSGNTFASLAWRRLPLSWFSFWWCLLYKVQRNSYTIELYNLFSFLATTMNLICEYYIVVVMSVKYLKRLTNLFITAIFLYWFVPFSYLFFSY